MFLHLGDGYMIPTRDIVLIGDLEKVNQSEVSQEFMEIATEEGFVIDYSDGNPKSFVFDR